MPASKNNEYNKIEDFKERLILSGVPKEIFEINIEDKDLDRLSSSFMLLGDINNYLESVLKVSSKRLLLDTHQIYSRQSFSYWCERAKISPRERLEVAGEGKDFSDVVLNFEEAIALLNHVIRFKLGIGKEPGIRPQDFTQISILFLMHFLSLSHRIGIELLGKFQIPQYQSQKKQLIAA